MPGTTDVALQSLTVGGRIELAEILAGFDRSDPNNAGSNGNASIGAVEVGRDWIASSISAGVQDTNGNGFGAGGPGADQIIPLSAGAPVDTIIARIASITIKGIVTGTGGLGDRFAFVAEQIGSFKMAGYTALLTSGNDGNIVINALTNDVSVHEY